MGSCLSKKGSSSSSSMAVATPTPDPSLKTPTQEEKVQKKTVQAEERMKEIFVVKQRKSHERRPEEKGIGISTQLESCNGNVTNFSSNVNGGRIGAPVRTSSCTKEEVDAILIQCGRLSRSSSGKTGGGSGDNNDVNPCGGALGGSGSRKYSGSKRSFDFDHDESPTLATKEKKGNNNDDDEDEEGKEMEKQHRSLHQSRRTPSREKDVEYKRSGSRDCASSVSGEETKRSGSGGRRVSRGPGRRSETPSAISDKSRPGKIVSVPASVSTRDKTSSAAAIPESATGNKKVSVKRSGEVGLRSTASPRSQSPVNNARVDTTHQQPSLSRNSSRKAEHSPYRRYPLNEINENSLRNEQNPPKSQDQINGSKVAKRNKKSGDAIDMTKKPSDFQSQKPDERSDRTVRGMNDHNNRDPLENNVMNREPKEQQQNFVVLEESMEAKETLLPPKTSKVVTVMIGSRGAESPKPQTNRRGRSSRRSRDLDLNLDGFNPDTLLNPTSYASLLLEDIQNFHQQSTSTFSLPPCVTKACSILEALADLNSCTSSNLSPVFSDNRISGVDQSKIKSNSNVSSSTANLGKRRLEAKEPFVESEVVVNNDLMEPSLHKYVTVRRNVMGGELEQQESSGSNSFIGQHWASSSSWEPNSADSTDCWTSRSNTGEEIFEKYEPNLLGCQNLAFSEVV